jgi:hypothetical protein
MLSIPDLAEQWHTIIFLYLVLYLFFILIFISDRFYSEFSWRYRSLPEYSIAIPTGPGNKFN